MYRQLMDRIAKSDDVDVAQLFHEDRQPLKSPTDRDKRRAERVELEDTYINVRCACSSSRLFCVVSFILHVLSSILPSVVRLAVRGVGRHKFDVLYCCQ